MAVEEFDTPEDAMREAARRHQQHHQAMEVQRHEIRRLFTDLPKDHLVSLTSFLELLSASGEGTEPAVAHFHGVAKTYLEVRFGVCTACGINHDEAIKKMSPETQAPKQQPLPFPDYEERLAATGVEVDPAYREIAENAHEAFVQNTREAFKEVRLQELPEHYRKFLLDNGLTANYGPDLKVGESGQLTFRQVKAMEAYNLDDLREKTDKVLLGFVCMNCGQTYPSIEDRMLKAPDDCPGCHTKAAHG